MSSEIEELQQAVASLERKVRSLEKVAIQHRARMDAMVSVIAREVLQAVTDRVRRISARIS